jgi:TonB family protein
MKRRLVVVAALSLSVSFLRVALASTEKSDAELSRFFIGNWELKPTRRHFPFTESFVSVSSNSTFKLILIANSSGYRGREERQGKWRITNGRLITQTVSDTSLKLDYSREESDSIAIHDNVVTLRSRDGDVEEMRTADVPTQLSPLLPRDWFYKSIVSKPQPDYSMEARRLRLEGQGHFKLSINDQTGLVDSVRTMKSTGHKLLDEAAIKALRNWRFKPRTLHQVIVPIVFVLRKNNHVAQSLATSARTDGTTVTGIVVDSHGRPVSQAVISAGLRERQFTPHGAERFIMMDIQAGGDGRFEFTTTDRISDLTIRADSPDLKHSGRLDHIAKKGNVIVVR